MDWSKIDDPDFSQQMVRQLDDAVARGARGLKLLKDWGLGVRDKTGKLVAIDDPRMDPVWRECGRLGIPVSIHSGDPEAFFRPTDASNERYEELTEHPDWSFSGPRYPRLEELLDARNRVFARHPETRFVSLHMGWPENLPWVSRMLDEHPNVMVEFGAREAELGRQPRQTREFFLKYQDRVMFGTDNGMEEEMYRNHFRWLETADESFDPWGYPGQGRWEIYGLDLPDPVLEKIYHLNAEKMFRQFKGASQGRETMSAAGRKKKSFHRGRLCGALLLLAAVFVLSAGCNPSTAPNRNRGGGTLTDQGGSETGRPHRADHEFGGVPDIAFGIHTGIPAQGRSAAQAGPTRSERR